MPAKVDTYLDLARETAQGLAGSVGAWTAFLDTASRLYKYPFADQHIAVNSGSASKLRIPDGK